MTKTAINHNSWPVAIFLILAASAAALIGCVNVNVDADSYARKYLAVADRATAIHIAKDRARQEGIQVDDYQVSAKEEKGDYWWVTFDLTIPSETRGWPAHFAVRVASDGSAEVYKNK